MILFLFGFTGLLKGILRALNGTVVPLKPRFPVATAAHKWFTAESPYYSPCNNELQGLDPYNAHKYHQHVASGT